LKKAGTKPALNLLEAYKTMLQARLVDEKIIVLYKQNKCHFQIGVAGHEAIQVAASHVFKAGKDWFYPYYRDMALCAGLGMTNREFFLNSMNKKDDPNSHGRQMPMHYSHRDLNIVSQSSPTGTQYLQAVGCALAMKLRKKDSVVYVSSGEGACAQGDFHEALNWASRDKLPVVFLIENNKFAISVHVTEQFGGKSVYKLTRGFDNLERHEIDGTDYASSFETLTSAHKRALGGKGPSLVEAHVPRLQSHSISDNQLKYRSPDDIEHDKKDCPIFKLKQIIIKNKIASASELEEINQELKNEIDKDAEWAENQPECDPASALTHVYKDPYPKNAFPETPADGEEAYMVDALNHALDEELKRDSDVYVFGEDVAYGKGGVFTVTSGLTDKYGDTRVFNTQLAESSIIGVAIGMATMGLKPVPEIQFADYVWTAMMQIRNELAMMNYRSAGDFSCPVVVRVPCGGYIHGSAYHSQNIEATFAHFPGLYVVYPSNAGDAKGLLKSAIRSKDPVIFLEHKGLYRQVYAKGPEGGPDHLVPLGKAKVIREGSDATIISWGSLVYKSLLAAKELAEEGYEVEVIDIRSIVPLDTETIFESVKKTSRVLIAHEDIGFMGFGAEIAAQIQENCFSSLDAPIKRIAAKSVAAIPHAQTLEDAVLPQNHEVIEALLELLKY
jgi:2-oxoisovalerate dehydrogenase E1 component